MIGVNLMSEHLILSIGAASVVSFIAVAAVFAVVYGIGLWVECVKRK